MKYYRNRQFAIYGGKLNHLIQMFYTSETINEELRKS